MDTGPMDLEPWRARVQKRREEFQQSVGNGKLAALAAVGGCLSSLREHKQAQASDHTQMPWLPIWPGLFASPVHDISRFPSLIGLQQIAPSIRHELNVVSETFAPAAYSSTSPDGGWETFYFFFGGKPVKENLARCPATASALAKIPHNGLHVCFSALAPGSSLHPHTGPTNTSLTAHLGLKGCVGAKLHVAGREIDYVEDQAFVFDDSYLHWVTHSGPATRYTLMITLWHPDLNWAERTVLRLLAKSIR
jgi:aspartyl/asparaginyl beta-hydroxylase (cupin superfamily)